MGEDSVASLRLLEVRLRADMIKLEKETKNTHYEEITKLKTEINEFKSTHTNDMIDEL